ncbi:DUF3450 domain-containing protein [Halomonas sp. WWR20]
MRKNPQWKMPHQPSVLMRGWAMLLFLLCLPVSASWGQDSLRDESVSAQREQAALQERIDAADEETRQALERLREAEREAQRLESYNEELAPRVERQAETLARREQAMDDLEVTRESLPRLMRSMVTRLRRLIEADMPFLRQERLARVASLETMLTDEGVSLADKWDRLFAAWRTELDYGRDMDSWRGVLEGDETLEVDYLRIGRVGLYYLTPDGHRGGVWKTAQDDWQPLNDTQLTELRKGIRIAQDQRAPELLALPVSVAQENATSTSADTQEPRS